MIPLCLVLLLSSALADKRSAESAIAAQVADLSEVTKQCQSLFDAAEYEKAELLCKKGLEQAERSLGREHLGVTPLLKTLSEVYAEQDKYGDAESLALRALKIREAALGPEHPQVAELLNQMGESYRGQGRYKDAEPLFVRALKIREEKLGPAHPDVAVSLNNVAEVSDKLGKYDGTEVMYQRAIQIWESVHGRMHPTAAIMISNLATRQHTLGRLEEAESLYLRALAIREAALGREHPQVASSLSVLGLLYYTQGRDSAAEPLLIRAVKIAEAAPHMSQSDLAVMLNNLAGLHVTRGNWTLAEPLYLRALKIEEAAFGLEHPAVAETLVNVASLFHRLERCEEASAFYRRAIGILQRRLGPEHPAVARALNQLGVMYIRQGRYREAEEMLKQASRIWEVKLGPAHHFVAFALTNLAGISMRQGRFDEAEPLLERALAIAAASLGTDHPLSAHVSLRMAALYVNTGRNGPALQQLSRALSVQEGLLRRTVSEPRLATLLTTLRDDEEAFYAMLADVPDAAAARLALSAALLRKGRTLEESEISRRAILDSMKEPQQQERYRHLLGLRAQHEALVWAGPGKLKDYRLRRQQLRQEADALEQELAEHSYTLRRLRLPEPEQIVQAVAAALPADGALIEVVTVRRASFTHLAPRSARAIPRYLALVLLPDASVSTVDLGDVPDLDGSVLQLLGQLHRSGSHPQPAASALYRRLFAPLLGSLKGRKRVYLAPDGQLNLLPFAALHDGQDYLIERYQFSYLTSGRDLLRQPLSPATRELIVVANPDFGAEPPRLEGPAVAASPQTQGLYAQLGQIPPLPGAAEEARQLAALFPAAVVLQGSQASELAVRSLRSPGILHIATHGVFLDSPGTEGGRESTRGGGEVERRLSVLVAGPQLPPPISEIESPLNRSALLLAGAARAAHAGDRSQDGLLTAEEVVALDLRGTELVVLSACDSGRGAVQTGQGVYGLRRAFVIAGAQTLVASLWHVADAETGSLMVQYYRNLRAGQGRVEALRSAARELKKKRGQEHPYYWAPFIVLGVDAPLRFLDRS